MSLRTNTLTTKREVASAFAATGSARALAVMIPIAAVIRLVAGDWAIADLAVAIGIVTVIGPVEWIIHLVLLHASPDAWTTRVLGTSTGHRQHHIDPPAIDFLLLRRIDALVFGGLLGVLAAIGSIPFAIVFGGSTVATALTAVVVALVALAHYEWTHLLVHTAYRPRSRYYARLARNHRRHHYRNERYWLGVTSNLGDRIMRTLPKSDESVPRSETARTLGG